MTDIAIAHSNLTDSTLAGKQLAEQISTRIAGCPDALVVFASPVHDFSELLRALNDTCQPVVMVGCSSAGEFTSVVPRVGSACALAFRSDEMVFSAGVGRQLGADRRQAARDITSSFKGVASLDYAYRTAMVLTDALAGFADSLVEELTLCTEGMYQLFGGGAGDDAKFERTHIFFGTEVITDAAVALEILSNKPIGVGVKHGWVPASQAMRVTEAEGNRLIRLNAAPAIEAFEAHADITQQTFTRQQPEAFFLSNVIGIEVQGEYRLRVPLSVNDRGEIICAAEVPAGSVVRIMCTSSASAADAAAQATKAALAQLHSHEPQTAIFFDCVATRLRTGLEFGLELQALDNVISPTTYIGCNTYGQIARAEGQFGGFHNCTAVIGIFPK